MKICGNIVYDEVYNSKTQKYDLVDVTAVSHQHLSDIVTLENVTIRDIYSILAKNIILQELLTHNFVKEFIAHLATNPTSPKRCDDPEADIEYIEVYRSAEFDEALNRLEFPARPSIHGMSMVLTREYDGFPIGQRINWSLSFKPVEHFIDKPIKVNTLVQAYTGNVLNHITLKNRLFFENPHFTFLDILNAITYELSFYGSPSDTQEISEDFYDAVDEIQEAIEDGSIEEIIAQQEIDDDEDIFNRQKYIKGMSFVDSSVDKKEMNHLISFIPNKVDITVFFFQLFGNKIVLKEEFIGLTAYEYRHKIYEYDEDRLPSMEMINIISKKEGIRGSAETVIDDHLITSLEEMGIHTTKEEILAMETF